MNTEKDKKGTVLITITFCDRAKNHAGMQMIGTQLPRGLHPIAHPFTHERLSQLSQEIENSKLYDLTFGGIEASVLVIRGFASGHCNLFAALQKLKAQAGVNPWDTKAFMKGKVVNKRARYNLCFADFDQEPDYDNKKGTVVNFAHVKYLSKLRGAIEKNFDTGCKLVAEGNLYYDTNKCYIG